MGVDDWAAWWSFPAVPLYQPCIEPNRIHLFLRIYLQTECRWIKSFFKSIFVDLQHLPLQRFMCRLFQRDEVPHQVLWRMYAQKRVCISKPLVFLSSGQSNCWVRTSGSSLCVRVIRVQLRWRPTLRQSDHRNYYNSFFSPPYFDFVCVCVMGVQKERADKNIRGRSWAFYQVIHSQTHSFSLAVQKV